MNEPAERPRYVLRLFVTGATQRSANAIANIRRICEQHLPDNYDLHVVDLYEEPVLVDEHQIIAAPTLVKQLPLPVQRFIGDLSNTEIVLVGLGLDPEARENT